MKRCTNCKKNKDESCFYKHKNEPGGLSYWCKECRKLADKAHYITNREWALIREWRSSLIRRYKLSYQEYYALLDKQHGVCAVCKQPERTQRQLCVDHDHGCCKGETSCGKCIRGLLCSRCNRGLGLLQDNEDILKQALRYIKHGHTNQKTKSHR
jgi:hypothetical protein